MADDARADDAALAAERSEVVGDALARLSERCRSLLRVFAFSPDAGYTEIAASLGMPVGSIGPTRQRCLGHLRRRLESVGYLSEAAG
jgi:DNA-directed RNA polymerase specialized sigma24 family protein